MNDTNAQNKKQAVIYCRVSTRDQVEDGNSLATQERICKEYCSKNGYDIAETYIEQGESAKTAERTELQKLLAFCAIKKNYISAVVIYKIDRLSRNTDDYSQLRLLLKRYGVEIKSTSEYFENTPVGRFMENTMANIAQFDNDIRTERSVGGMREAMREGRYVWPAPVGYNNVKIGGRSTIAPDAKRFPLVREMFYLLAKNDLGPEAIRILMGKRGLANTKGKPLSKSFYYRIIKNEVYTGWIIKFGERHKGLFEPVIPEDIFEQVQRIIKNKGKKSIVHITDNPDFPLRRFIRNTEGAKLTGSWSKGCRKKYPYYKFTGKHLNFSREKFQSLFMEFMDRYSVSEEHYGQVVGYLKKHFLNSTLESKKRINQLEKYIDEIKAKQSALIQKNLSGIITDNILRNELAILENELLNSYALLLELQEDNLSFDGISDFAKQFLLQPSAIWKDSSIDVKLKLQWFQFPEGIVYNKNTFETTKIASVFKLKELFSDLESTKVHHYTKISNTSEMPYHEHLGKLRLEIKGLSEILNSDKPST